VSFVIDRIVLPVLLTALLGLQVVHYYVDWARYHVPVYSATYAIRESDKFLLPTGEDMKRIAVQLGAQEGIGLTDRNVEVVVLQDVLRITIRPEGRGDWERLFARYAEELGRATVSRWEQESRTGPCTCVSRPLILFKGWSGSRESLIKPLDIVSLIVLTVALVGSLTGHGAGRKQ